MTIIQYLQIFLHFLLPCICFTSFLLFSISFYFLIFFVIFSPSSSSVIFISSFILLEVFIQFSFFNRNFASFLFTKSFIYIFPFLSPLPLLLLSSFIFNLIFFFFSYHHFTSAYAPSTFSSLWPSLTFLLFSSLLFLVPNISFCRHSSSFSYSCY